MTPSFHYPVENIRAIREQFAQYIEDGGLDAAYDLYTELRVYIDQNQKKLESNRAEFDLYNDALAKAGWMVFDRFPAEQIYPLFEKSLKYFFVESGSYRKDQLQRVCAVIALYTERDQVKLRIRNALEVSNATIGESLISLNGSSMPPTVSSWIADFRQFKSDGTITDPLLLTEYLNTAQNPQSLSSENREKLQGILQFYQYIATPSLGPRGAIDDVYYYDDLYSGHIFIHRDGQDIDTGEESPVIAAMAPQERELEKRRFERNAEAFLRIDMNAVQNGDISSYERYLEEIAQPLPEEVESGTVRKAALNEALNATTQPSSAPVSVFVDQQKNSFVDTASSAVSEHPDVVENKALKQVVPPHPAQRNANTIAAQHEEHVMLPKKIQHLPDANSVALRQSARPRVRRTQTTYSGQSLSPVSFSGGNTGVDAAGLIAQAQQQSLPKPNASAAPLAPAKPQSMLQQKSFSNVAPQAKSEVKIVVPTPQGAQSMKKNTTPSFDVVTLAQQVLSDHGLLLDSAETERRFVSLIGAFVRGEQPEQEVVKSLTMPSAQGGINVTARIAQSVLAMAMDLTRHPERIHKRKSIAHTRGRQVAKPTFAMASQAIEEKKQLQQRLQEDDRVDSFHQNNTNNIPVAKPSAQGVPVEDIFANLDTSSMGQVERPIVPDPLLSQSVHTSATQDKKTRIMSPLDELRHFSLPEFRAYTGGPAVATKAILDKIAVVGEQSVAKRADAIHAWQQSPVHQLYVNVGNASLQSGISVDQYIEQHQNDKEMLSPDEFDAVSQLNRQLRY